MKKAWTLIMFNRLIILVNNIKIKLMCNLGYTCETCKYCDPVCYFAGEISGKDFWCKYWKKEICKNSNNNAYN